MTRTSAGPLLLWAVAGTLIGYFLEAILVRQLGQPLFVPAVSFPVTLVFVAALLIAFALPIRRAATGTTGGNINPFRAMRVAALARASSHVGALLSGVFAGILLFLFQRLGPPEVSSVWLSGLSLVSAAILLAAGLVAEHLCRLPKDDERDDDNPGPLLTS